MNSPITYDLTDGKENSNRFYSELDTFSRTVLEQLRDEFTPLIQDFSRFLSNHEVEKIRTDGEYGIELLTLAMTWNHYLGASQNSSISFIFLLKNLFFIRQRFPFFKKYLDPIRGLVSGHFLAPNINISALNSDYNYKNFSRLILWLDASGEFRDEVIRFNNWYVFFKSQTPGYFENWLQACLSFFNTFKTDAKAHLGVYTQQVESFLINQHPLYKNREDQIFCGKEEVEYHINMVASQIMNFGLLEDFKETKRRVVLVPGCMRIDESLCKAQKNFLDIKCTGCNYDCNVNRVRLQGMNENFEVFIVPHSSTFTKWLDHWKDKKDCGIIASACLLNIAVGGYQMRDRGIASQCILLDYCGCKKHWHSKGISTDLNSIELSKKAQL